MNTNHTSHQSTSTSRTNPSASTSTSTSTSAQTTQLGPSQKPNPSSAPSSSTGSSSHQHHHHHNSLGYQQLSYEERLPKLWRQVVSSIANGMNKAEKAGAESSQANCRDLNDSMYTFLRTRMEWHRLIGTVEAKLQGKAQEREALEGYVRTQPRLGKRKRTSTADLMVTEELQTALQEVTGAESIATSSIINGSA